MAWVGLTWLIVDVEPDWDDLLLVALTLLRVTDHLEEGVTRDLAPGEDSAMAGHRLVRAAGPTWDKELNIYLYNMLR